MKEKGEIMLLSEMYLLSYQSYNYLDDPLQTPNKQK